MNCDAILDQELSGVSGAIFSSRLFDLRIHQLVGASSIEAFGRFRFRHDTTRYDVRLEPHVSAKKLASISWQSAVCPLPPMSIDHLTLIVDGPDLQDGRDHRQAVRGGMRRRGDRSERRDPDVDFDREAASLDEAALSAVRDVGQVDGVSVIRLAGAGVRIWKCLVEKLLFLDASFFEKIRILRV